MLKQSIKNYIFCALDFRNIRTTERLLDKIAPRIGGIKIGLEFFLANGRSGVKRLQKFNLPIFLDLKLHDIPNTVKKSVESIIDLQPEYISVHISGGEQMLRMINRNNYSKIIGITLLTSLNKKDLLKQGIQSSPENYVSRLVEIANEVGLDGVVSSPSEIPVIRKNSSKKFIIISPGIRLKNDLKDDQKRIMSPGEAIYNGATKIVIGRSITNARDPLEALKQIKNDIKEENC